MRHTAGLVAAVIGLLILLEIFSALFNAVCDALAKDMAKQDKAPVWTAPFVLLRWVLAMIAKIGTTTSLIMHETAHAIAQFLFGGKPRITLLRNGGYAKSTPWSNALPARIVHNIGSSAGLGVMCLAPILVGATLILALHIATTPLDFDGLPNCGDLFVYYPEYWFRAVEGIYWQLVDSPWWAYPILVVGSLLIVPCMTPSSVDYAHGSLHLLAYGIATIVCTGVAEHSQHALWFIVIGGGVSGLVGMTATAFPDWVRRLLGGLGLGTALIALCMALADSPVGTLHTDLGILIFALGLAAITYLAFVALFLGLSLISVRPGTLWLALAAAPRQLVDIVRPFHACETCRIHYRGTCDGCGRTP
jgi:hypothetical protein